MALVPYYNTIVEMMQQGETYDEMSLEKVGMGLVRGASVTNIKRFCTKHNLKKNGLVSDGYLERAVAEAVQETGPMYGRKMMTGYLASKGVHASEKWVAAALHDVQPEYQEQRVQRLRNLNPVPYNAAYFGQKLHIDQNKKMAMFGVTYVAAIDGYSGKIVSHSVMPIKNNCIIYDEVFRNAVLTYGLWDQLRIDHGREFLLSLFVQQKLGHQRFSQARPPYLQTRSTENHRIERVWPEVNRVTYPLKAALIQPSDQEVLDFEEMRVKYCVSNFSCKVAAIGLERFISAWNCHPIPGRGVPNALSEGGCQVKVPLEDLPEPLEAAGMCELEWGSNISRTSTFGTSPFETVEAQQAAERRICELHPNIHYVYDAVVNGEPRPFQEALMDIVTVSCRQ